MTNKLTYQVKKVVLWSSLFLFLLSCSESKGERVCKVGSHILHERELEARMELYIADYGEEEARKKAISQWAKQQRIKEEVQTISPMVLTRNKLQTEDDLMKLNLFELENIAIQTRLDTVIKQKEIQEFYDTHRENYKSKSYIVHALLITVPDSLTKDLKLDKYYLLKNDKDREKIKKYANLYASNYYFEEERWIYFDDLVRGIPMSNKNKEELIKGQGHGTFKRNEKTTYINILNHRVKSISSPMDIEQDRIRNDILKRRANKIRSKVKETILENVNEKYPISYF